MKSLSISEKHDKSFDKLAVVEGKNKLEILESLRNAGMDNTSCYKYIYARRGRLGGRGTIYPAIRSSVRGLSPIFTHSSSQPFYAMST